MLANLRAGLQRSEIPDLGTTANDNAFLDHAGRADVGIRPDLDMTDDKFIAFDACITELDLRTDAGTCANRQQIIRTNIEFADERIFTNLCTERRQIKTHQGRSLKPFDMRQRYQPLHQPPAIIIDAPQRITAGFGAPKDQPFRANADEDCPRY